MPIFNLPEQVEFVINRLNSRGFSGYAVGGCVRDHLMGKSPSDYDVTTNAKPYEMLDIFSDCRVVETGLKHGTITVVKDKMNIEVTTYRIDGVYADNRHPTEVTFTDNLSEDLCRRDFTINAMAYAGGEIVDLFGGQSDLDKKIIRCVGSPDKRFSEDGLRILRALRFASVLDFTLDDDCRYSVHRMKFLLDNISRERIHVEFTKLLLGQGCGRILREFPDVIACVFPQLSEGDIVSSAEKISSSANSAAVRYAVLLNSLEAKEAADFLNSLNPSRAEKSAVLNLLSHRSIKLKNESDVRLLISSTTDEFPAELADFQLAVGEISQKERDKIVFLAQDIVNKNLPRKLSDLTITGRDVAEFGYTGEKIGTMLSQILVKIIKNEFENDRNSIINYIESQNHDKTDN